MKDKAIKFLKYGLLGIVGIFLNLLGLTILDVPLSVDGWQMILGILFIYGSFLVWTKEIK